MCEARGVPGGEDSDTQTPLALEHRVTGAKHYTTKLLLITLKQKAPNSSSFCLAEFKASLCILLTLINSILKSDKLF